MSQEPEDDRVQALLSALNELCVGGWVVTPGREFYAFTLTVAVAGRESFLYHRSIRPHHIHSEPYRTALGFLDEVCERFGRYLLLRPDDADA